jgi:hypothetical protein
LATTTRSKAKRARRSLIAKAAQGAKKGAARAIDAAGKAAKKTGRKLQRAGR